VNEERLDHKRVAPAGIFLPKSGQSAGSGASEPQDGLVSEDRLLDGRVILYQPRRGYRVAVDALCMAAAVPAQAGESLLELGCGVGAGALCLLARVPGVRVIGLEVQREFFDLALRNAAANAQDNSFTPILGAVEALPEDLPKRPYDHVFFNPPYLSDVKPGRRPQDPQRHKATREGAVTLGTWVDTAARCLKPNGSLTVIHRADRLDDVLAALSPAFGGTCIFPLWPKQGRTAKRILVQARRGSRAPLALLSGLVLHQEDGSFSPKAQAVLRDGKALEIRWT
jgi:tRNA1(Val) A37 N6-methylase TrmN6